MSASLQEHVDTATPAGLEDHVVRAIKTAITTFVGIVGANVAGWTDVNALKAAGIAALASAATVLLNVVLTWASS